MSIAEHPPRVSESISFEKPRLFVRRATSENDWREVLRIRREVFVEEQGLVDTAIQERDDEISWTYLVDLDGCPIGTGRLTPPRGVHPAYIAWVATRRKHRGLGAASLLVERLLNVATQAQIEIIVLNAQQPVINLYRRYGFQPNGIVVHLRAIPHQPMVLRR